MADSVTGLVGEVRTERERLETVINSIDDGIVVLDRQRNIIAANDASCCARNISPDQVLGCSCRQMAPGGCTVADAPPGLPRLRCAAGAHLRATHARGRRGVGGGARLSDSRCRRRPESRWWKSGGIFPSAARPRRTWPNPPPGSLGILAFGFLPRAQYASGNRVTCVEGVLRESSSSAPPTPVGSTKAPPSRAIRFCGAAASPSTSCGFRAASAALATWSNFAPAIDAVARLIEPTARAHMVRIEVGPIPPGVRVRADEAEVQHTL